MQSSDSQRHGRWWAHLLNRIRSFCNNRLHGMMLHRSTKSSDRSLLWKRWNGALPSNGWNDTSPAPSWSNMTIVNMRRLRRQYSWWCVSLKTLGGTYEFRILWLQRLHSIGWENLFVSKARHTRFAFVSAKYIICLYFSSNLVCRHSTQTPFVSCLCPRYCR